jgi:hypothetical protein
LVQSRLVDCPISAIRLEHFCFLPGLFLLFISTLSLQFTWQRHPTPHEMGQIPELFHLVCFGLFIQVFGALVQVCLFIQVNDPMEKWLVHSSLCSPTLPPLNFMNCFARKETRRGMKAGPERTDTWPCSLLAGPWTAADGALRSRR